MKKTTYNKIVLLGILGMALKDGISVQRYGMPPPGKLPAKRDEGQHIAVATGGGDEDIHW